MTPYLLVDTNNNSITVPQEYIQNNQIILNIHPEAVHQLVMDNEAVTFNARFGGKPFQIYVPVNSVTAIYAKETGKGLVFPEVEDESESNTDAPEKTGKPHLKVIK